MKVRGYFLDLRDIFLSCLVMKKCNRGCLFRLGTMTEVWQTISEEKRSVSQALFG
jgi:hypothetical protein